MKEKKNKYGERFFIWSNIFCGKQNSPFTASISDQLSAAGRLQEYKKWLKWLYLHFNKRE